MKMRKALAAMMAAGMLLTAAPAIAEEAPETAIVDTQKLDASYTLALNAINAEDYATAKEYLNICFAYCDPQTNPTMYADLLLKRACIDVIEERNDMALLSLDAALRIQPDLADAYLVRTQVYSMQNDVDHAIENLEKYIELSGNAALYETVAQLNEAKGDLDAAQAAYDKYVESAGSEVAEAGFQSGLYRMEAGRYEEAIKAFEAYIGDETYGAGAEYNIGICKMNMGDYAGAVEAFTACADKGGNFDGLYYNRGICHLLSAEWDSAAADFSQSFTAESFKSDARYNLAICRMQQGNYESAIGLFSILIDAAAAAAEGDGSQAENTVNDGAYYYRGVCYASIGKLDEAIADFTTCIDHGYELAQSYYQRAQLYAAKGDTEKQNSDLQNSLKYAE